MLTPSLILSLRASVRYRGPIDISAASTSLITWAESERMFQLSAYGRVMALSPDIALLGYLLQAERAQRGYIAEVLSTSIDPETACLDHVERQRVISAQRELAATLRAREREDEVTRREANRRLSTGTASSDPRSLAYKPPIADVEFDSL